MAKFTIHNQHNDFINETANTIETAKIKCDQQPIKCKVMESYFAPSPWNPKEITEHGKEVYRNY